MSSNTIVKDTAVNKPQLLEVHNQRLRVYNNQSTQDVLDVSLEAGHGLATEATLDSFRTENASNLGAIDSTLTDGTSVVKVMGSEDATTSGTQHQLHIDGSGNLLVKEVGTVNVAPSNDTNSGITDAPTNSVAVGLKARTDKALASSETFLLCDSQGHLQVDLLNQNVSAQMEAFTDINDVSSVKRLLCDTDGHLQVDIVSGGGGGGSSSTTYNNLAFNILKPTAPAIQLQTNTAGIDLTNCSNLTAGIYITYQSSLGGSTTDISDVVVQYSHDNSIWWSDALGGGGGFWTATVDLDGTMTGYETFFIEIQNFKARYIRLCALHQNSGGQDMATTAHLQLRPF